jgi:hypothetical protein
MANIEREMEAARAALPEELRAITVAVPRSYLRYLEQKVVTLAQQNAGAVDLLRDVATAGVEFDDSRLGYVSVQIDRATWDALASYRGQ